MDAFCLLLMWWMALYIKGNGDSIDCTRLLSSMHHIVGLACQWNIFCRYILPFRDNNHDSAAEKLFLLLCCPSVGPNKFQLRFGFYEVVKLNSPLQPVALIFTINSRLALNTHEWRKFAMQISGKSQQLD